MRPTDFPADQQYLTDIWQTFTTSGQLTSAQLERLDPTVLLSWQRCRARLNPLSEPRTAPIGPEALASLLRAQSELISIATPIIEDIQQSIEGAGCIVLVADGSGCNLAMVGDDPTVGLITELGLGQGAYWSEGQIGTNALGTALASAMPAQVVGAEHYLAAFHTLAGSAAPIHDVRGRIVGAISICSRIQQATPHALAVVMAAALAISNQIQAGWSLQEANHRLSEVNTFMSTVSEGVLAWNIDGEIHHVNEKASKMLGLNSLTTPGQNISDVLQLPALIAAAVENGDELNDREVSFQSEERAVRSLVNLRTIKDAHGQAVSFIALLRPIEQIRQLVQQQSGSRARLTIADVYGQAPAMRRVLRQSRMAARGTAPILLRGEGGVGKNHLAQAVHNDGSRADKPYLSINCRAIPHELMTGELLGEDENNYVRPSKFELADGGTLFLDQVDSLSLEMQAAVLQVIETGHVLHLGGNQPIPVDIRVIVATSRNLEQLVSDGSFLSHFYYRFGVFNIYIPPLRERVEDIPLLAERFLARITNRDSRAKWIADSALEILLRYPWPGNVRELESVLERAILQSRDGIIRPGNLPEIVRQRRVIMDEAAHTQPVLSVNEAEREAILRAGWACRGRVSEMARQLQIGRTTLWRKMKRHNIVPEQFKSASEFDSGRRA